MQSPEEELEEWRALKGWLMDYPSCEDDIAINNAIHNAPARQIVKHIQDEFQRLKMKYYAEKISNNESV